MSKDDILLLIIAATLLGAMILTIFFRGGESKHGVGLSTPGGTQIFTLAVA